MTKNRSQKPESRKNLQNDSFRLLIKRILTGSLVILFIGVCSFAILFIAMCLL